MPQLLPDPWLMIFMYSWMILICLAPKILKHPFLNEPAQKTSKLLKFTWTWLW
uniref:ATP synthase complex subunit 8 n=1 Tax=Limnonectes fragilis TaxID=291939 RepID=K9J8I9_LIMFA|nr:ATPase 8 [Limnonectes fragilis]